MVHARCPDTRGEAPFTMADFSKAKIRKLGPGLRLAFSDVRREGRSCKVNGFPRDVQLSSGVQRLAVTTRSAMLDLSGLAYRHNGISWTWNRVSIDSPETRRLPNRIPSRSCAPASVPLYIHCLSDGRLARRLDEIGGSMSSQPSVEFISW